jgi:hypothetical protein
VLALEDELDRAEPVGDDAEQAPAGELASGRGR